MTLPWSTAAQSANFSSFRASLSARCRGREDFLYAVLKPACGRPPAAAVLGPADRDALEPVVKPLTCSTGWAMYSDKSLGRGPTYRRMELRRVRKETCCSVLPANRGTPCRISG
jgi:hypothetical protein